MHSAIFYIDANSNLQKWSEFQSTVTRNTAIAAYATKLGDRVWIADFHTSPAALSALVSLAEACELRYGVLPLQDEPKWLPPGFDPAKI